MSLILDAINRSNRERANPGEVPGIATQHYSDSAVPAASSWSQGLLALALVLALTLIAWLLLAPKAASPVNTSPLDVAPVASIANSATSSPALKPAAQPVVLESSHRVAAPELRPALIDSTNAKPQPPAEVAALYTQGSMSESAELSLDEPAEAEPLRSSASQQVEAQQSNTEGQEQTVLDVDALLRQAQSQMQQAKAVEHAAPFLADLSQQQKDAIPTVLYSAHDYHADATRSKVLINGQSASAGSSIGKGLRVEEILPDSVVLSFAGQSFRLPALSSWVNL
ncbi:general secretion pathway protein GspB [Parahaliea sp. F7430]|uniref:General secretion pathway protein GspB n=1 Tax=Sediminihaliea albiluteola TaxID=2758564 RepID=A0A7W2YJH0_9GAMM|nr:general secretion pathway protein GspB [Sediminihaliea albiluteola]MBA6412624.1 general secretion pathway protein GspB [Sediminihaliea albiluteola]